MKNSSVDRRPTAVKWIGYCQGTCHWYTLTSTVYQVRFIRTHYQMDGHLIMRDIFFKPVADLDHEMISLLYQNALNLSKLLKLENFLNDPSLGWHKHRLQLQTVFKNDFVSDNDVGDKACMVTKSMLLHLGCCFENDLTKAKSFMNILSLIACRQHQCSSYNDWSLIYETFLDIRNIFYHTRKY